MKATSILESLPAGRLMRRARTGICKAAVFMWKWSVPYKNQNRPQDDDYAAIWKTNLEEAYIRAALHVALPDITLDQLPAEEEHIRQLIRQRFTPLGDMQDIKSEKHTDQKKIWNRVPEEAWPNVPETIRHVLAAANAKNMENKLQFLREEDYHPSQGLAAILRHKSGVNKTFRIWRCGFAAGVSRTERIYVNIFFLFLIFCSVYPNVAAGFLDERSYNQRSIGSRIMTLFQPFFLWTFPYHTLWLLYNWSVERLLGGLVGSTVYACIAIFPAVKKANEASWFRTMVLVLTILWQMGVQFFATYEWKERVERYILFTRCFEVGRGADQLIGLLKDDMESIVNIYEDYRSTAKGLPDEEAPKKHVRDHIEPRLPKLMLVIFDIVIFAYPFTFNTVAAYSTVVVVKQSIVLCKRYQTVANASRLFTNMVAFNIWGIFLVSLPVTIDKNVLQDNGNWVGLTLAMIVAKNFLTEPIAPLFLLMMEKIMAGAKGA
ncbi:hypothetical protein BM221_000560 [Beauveria bassiana]|uniref:Uncharacterized protein n=1 Tax=Beauveria bassiana TaxID=176275 RepID=A0A2N6P0W0_BEABA|nr:hypothetical protein BM221_000560 [Beauveria bassiana]